MIESEIKLVNMLGDVWNIFLDLPVEHQCDAQEFCQSIHRL